MPLWTREQSWRIHQALGLWTNSPGLLYFLDGFPCRGRLWDPGASRDSMGRGEGPGGVGGHLVPSPRLLGLAGDLARRWIHRYRKTTKEDKIQEHLTFLLPWTLLASSPMDSSRRFLNATPPTHTHTQNTKEYKGNQLYQNMMIKILLQMHAMRCSWLMH